MIWRPERGRRRRRIREVGGLETASVAVEGREQGQTAGEGEGERAGLAGGGTVGQQGGRARRHGSPN